MCCSNGSVKPHPAASNFSLVLGRVGKTTLLLDIAAKFGDQAIYVAGIQRSISVTR
jgi:hypothetical protein